MSSDRTRTHLFGVFLAAPVVTAPQLVALARPLGVSATNVKSHLSRLVGEGVVRRRGPPRRAVYSLTERQRPIVEGIAARLDDPPDVPWQGEMLMIAVRFPTRREVRADLRAALWFDGFRPWGREVWLRPAWPMPWACERARAYVERGVALGVQGSIIGTVNASAFKTLYAIDRLDREASGLAETVSGQTKRFSSDAQAFAARLKLAGRVVDVIARDPRLPAALLPRPSGLQRLRTAYRRLMAETEAPAAAFVASVVDWLR